jgi:hypothetical protein
VTIISYIDSLSIRSQWRRNCGEAIVAQLARIARRGRRGRQETGPLRVPPMPLRNELSPRRGAKALTAPTPLSTALLFHACVSLPFLSHLPIYHAVPTCRTYPPTVHQKRFSPYKMPNFTYRVCYQNERYYNKKMSITLRIA